MLKNYLTVCSALILTACFSIVNFAHGADDLSGSRDADGIDRYPLSWIVEYQAFTVPDYRLALGKMKKKSGVIAPEKSRRLEGYLQRITYRIPDGHSPEEAFKFVAHQLQQQQAVVLFRCESRQCGSSHQWANQTFQVSRLYGVDRTQLYLAAELAEQFIALYAVKRGNKRVYLQLDVISPQAPAAKPEQETEVAGSDWLERFQGNGGAWLPVDFSRGADSTLLKSVTERLVAVLVDTDQPVLIAGYSNASGQSVLQSRVYAETVAAALTKKLDETRLTVLGVGSLQLIADVPYSGAVWIEFTE